MRALLVSGIPGSGKSTVARRLAERFERSAHLDGDAVGQGFVVRGFVPPEGPPLDEAEAQLGLRRRNLCLLADSFADSGFLPVLDDVVVSPRVLEGYLHTLRARPLFLVQLTPSVEVVRSRDAHRDKQAFARWRHLDAELRTAMPRVGLWLDTSRMSVDETVEAIVARLDQAEIRE